MTRRTSNTLRAIYLTAAILAEVWRDKLLRG